MKKPIHLTWQVKLIIFILCAAVVFLIVKSFKEGVEEGRQMKLKEAEEKTQ